MSISSESTQLIEVPSWVLNMATIGHIQPRSFMVYGVLLKHASENSEEGEYVCSIGIDQLCTETMLPVKECFTAIVDLQVNEAVGLSLLGGADVLFGMPIENPALVVTE